MKAPLRSKSIGTKVTDEEYARLEQAASARQQSMSEWCREALIAAADQVGGGANQAEPVVLGELLALRTIVVNLFFQLGQGEPMTPEEMKTIIERADAGKLRKAVERLAIKGRTGERAAASVAG
jgi:hypothetical protein